MRRTKQNQPWWLEAGGEICPTCIQAYVYQTEYRCLACDGPVCAECVVQTVVQTIEAEVFCPDCVGRGEEGTESEIKQWPQEQFGKVI